MYKLDFFTPVYYDNNRATSWGEFLIQAVDDYFYLGGKKACVIPDYTHQGSKGVLLSEDTPSFLIIAFKVSSYFTVILPIIMLIAKTALRTSQSFYVIDSVEGKIEISEKLIKEIKTLMPIINEGEENPKIIWHSIANNWVFSLTSNPDLIFKMPNPTRGCLLENNKQSQNRFKNMVQAKLVCLTYKLNNLHVSYAKIFNVNNQSIIVEKRADILHDSLIEEQYKMVSINAINSLAIFIIKTGFDDVEWRNIPVDGTGKIILIDLEHMGNPEIGLFGNDSRRGLLRCLHTQKQINAIKKVTDLYCWISKNHFNDSNKIRMEEIAIDESLQKFYGQKGILNNPTLPIEIENLNFLGLDLKEARGTLTLATAVMYVIAKINDTIRAASENSSIKGRRFVRLYINHDYELAYYNQDGNGKYRNWLEPIINALVKNGYLFSSKKVDPSGSRYLLQA